MLKYTGKTLGPLVPRSEPAVHVEHPLLLQPHGKVWHDLYKAMLRLLSLPISAASACHCLLSCHKLICVLACSETHGANKSEAHCQPGTADVCRSG